IKDYQVSGQDKENRRSRWRIHLRRLRLERELRSQQTSDNLPKRNFTCTERPQQWHIPRSNSSKDELVLLDELLVIKHNYEADKKGRKNEVRTQRKVEKQMYDAAPSFARKINEHQNKTVF
ncbi:unnamed protein product, partial [Porites lobata]